MLTGGAAALAGVLGAPVPARAEAPHVPLLVIQPLGKQLPRIDVEYVATSLAAFYGFRIRVSKGVPLPRAAYYPKRRRYRAERLLDHLKRIRPAGTDRMLGLTGVDISTTKGKHEDWGILGLATVDGRVGVLSKFRCKRLARSAKHARERLGKVAVHEIGHTLGLPHCPTRGCLMEDGQGTVLTSDREYDLCQICRSRLLRAGHSLADSSLPIPWPEPKRK